MESVASSYDQYQIAGGGFLWTLRANPASPSHLADGFSRLLTEGRGGEGRCWNRAVTPWSPVEPLPGPGLLPLWPLQDPHMGPFWRQSPGLSVLICAMGRLDKRPSVPPPGLVFRNSDFPPASSQNGQSRVLLDSGDTVASGQSGHQRKEAPQVSNIPST